MKSCANCGATISLGASDCARCGKSVASNKPTLYTSSKLGYVALFAAFLLFAIPLAYFLGGSSDIQDLRSVSGKVLGVQLLELPRGLRGITLEVALQGGGLEEFTYSTSRGDRIGSLLEQLNNRQVQLWVEPGGKAILQLEVEGTRLVDYGERSAALRGNPITLAVYWVLCLAVFLGITAIRRRRLAQSGE